LRVPNAGEHHPSIVKANHYEGNPSPQGGNRVLALTWGAALAFATPKILTGPSWSHRAGKSVMVANPKTFCMFRSESVHRWLQREFVVTKGLSPIYLEPVVARTSPKVISRNKRKLIVFGWYGGKFSHLDWLLPKLPKTNQYCEPFAGSGAVLLNRPPSPVETYNDIDGEVGMIRLVSQPNSCSVLHQSATFEREDAFLTH
jgi:hypothetical protein